MAKKVGTQTLIGIIAVLILALVGLAYYSDLIPLPPPPPPPDSHPTVTVTTEVVVEKGAPWDNFKIKSMDSYQAGTSAARSDLMLWPQEGTLKLKVVYPSGHEITITKKIKVESWDSTTVAFNWQTKQEGEHTLIAELYDKEGKLVDTETGKYTPIFPPS